MMRWEQVEPQQKRSWRAGRRQPPGGLRSDATFGVMRRTVKRLISQLQASLEAGEKSAIDSPRIIRAPERSC